MRDQILTYVQEQLNTVPETPWADSPDSVVLRHADNSKWYGLLMTIPEGYIGLPGNNYIDVMNVKLPPLMVDSFRPEPGFHAAYHMNKRHWLTIRLDGTVPYPVVLDLLHVSFDLTASKKKQGILSRTHDWLIPANPKMFDVEAAFKQQDVIRWKQGADIHVGDMVTLYEAAPWSCLRFRCKVEEVGIPSEKTPGKKLMKIRLLETYPADYMPLARLRSEFGVYSVRGPRSTPPALMAELTARAKEREKL